MMSPSCKTYRYLSNDPFLLRVPFLGTSNCVMPLLQCHYNSIRRSSSKSTNHQGLHSSHSQLLPTTPRSGIIPLDNPKNKKNKCRNSNRNEESFPSRVLNKVRNLQRTPSVHYQRGNWFSEDTMGIRPPTKYES